ncbi:MAG: sensor histidine kinase [Tannerella sp.]|nr:sensor histidine kinase [Tannerella sp.]
MANEICGLAYRRGISENVVFSVNDSPQKIHARVLFSMSAFAYANGNYQKALDDITEGLNIHEQLNDTPMVAHDLRRIAEIYARINQIENAISSFETSIAVSSAIGDMENEAKTLYSLGLFYLRKNRHKTGIQTIENVLSIARKIDNRELIANSLGTKGEYHLQYGDVEVALEAITQSLEICREIGTPTFLDKGLSRMGMVQMKTGEYDKAENNMLEALEISKQLEDKTAFAFNLMSLGDLKVAQNLRDEADRYYSQSVERCLELQNTNLLSVLYYKLYELHRTEEPVLSLEWLEKSIEIDDSLYYQGINDEISNFQIKYETEKKEIQIATLEREKQLFIWLGIAGAGVLLLALGLLFYRHLFNIQKRKLAENKIKQLEQEKQLVATQAVLDGEVGERTRLARDLHDGLGSMLTGTKMHFLEMKRDAKLEDPDVERFDKAMGLLDRSVEEMRRVAHHLMPDSLSRFGLKPSVSDFCSTLPSVEFVYYGDESRLEPKLEVMIYRCIYELVNNALRHSGANNIIVQIMQETDRIAFTVQDDGCGFAPPAESKGVGLQNIRTRVASYNGIINIDSSEGKGTEINVELQF